MEKAYTEEELKKWFEIMLDKYHQSYRYYEALEDVMSDMFGDSDNSLKEILK